MVLVTCNDGNTTHTGSTVVGPVTGTIDEGSNIFVTINGILVSIEDAIMTIPTHQYITIPPAFHAHSFVCNEFQQSYVTIEGNKIILLDDAYIIDMTSVTNIGSNTFVNIEV